MRKVNWTAAAVPVACMILGLGCSPQSAWQAPSAGLITKNGAGLFCITPQGSPGVMLFHGGDLNSSASHTSNPKTRAFDCTGRLTTGGGRQVTYRLLSSDPGKVTLNDAAYDLGKGSVFLITEAGGVAQLPFAPLEPSERYLDSLREYFDANKPVQATPR
jgi:hypothetical protein